MGTIFFVPVKFSPSGFPLAELWRSSFRWFGEAQTPAH